MFENEARGSQASSFVGPVISGNSLFDCSEVHEQVVTDAYNQFRLVALGGEMEGSGIIDMMTFDTQVPVVIIKGVCDWGRKKLKGFHQVAAYAAFKFLEELVVTIPVRVPATLRSRDAPDPVKIPILLDDNNPLAPLARGYLDAANSLETAIKGEAGTQFAELQKQLQAINKQIETSQISMLKKSCSKAAVDLMQGWDYDSDVI